MQLTEGTASTGARTCASRRSCWLIWFVVTFVVGYYARDLNFNFFGWPFSFWMGAQGALIIYVVIIWYYARYMNKLDQEYGVAEEE